MRPGFRNTSWAKMGWSGYSLRTRAESCKNTIFMYSIRRRNPLQTTSPSFEEPSFLKLAMSSSTQGNTVHLRESEGWTVFRAKKKLPLPLLFDFSGHRFLISYTPLVLKLKDFSDQAEVLEQIYLPESNAPFSR